MNGKTEITLLKSTALWGQTLLCPNKWKTSATVAEWDTTRSRVSQSRGRGAEPGETDTAHRSRRLCGDGLNVRETLSMSELLRRL